jgi:hypothetical protein
LAFQTLQVGCPPPSLSSARVTSLRLLGVLIGFSGVLLIARPWATTSVVDMTGVLYMQLGSASVGPSFGYAKKFLSDLDIPHRTGVADGRHHHRPQRPPTASPQVRGHVISICQSVRGGT